jgi:hypothetical protein
MLFLGYWEGNSNFEYSQAIYSAEFNNFQGSPTDYRKLLIRAFEKMNTIGQKAYTQNLGDNLIYWMIYTVSTNTYSQASKKHSLHLTGSPQTVFDRRYLYGKITNVYGNCNATSKVTYDRKNSLLKVSYSYSEYMSNPTCRNIVHPDHLGYISQYDGDDFSLTIDVQSLMTAIAVNSGILNTTELELVPFSQSSYVTDNVQYIVGKYYFPRFPGMQPLVCVLEANNPTNDAFLCGIQFGSIYTQPFFNHFGRQFYEPDMCTCDVYSGIEDDNNYACNWFNFIAGFVFFEYNTDSSDSVDALTRFIIKSKGKSSLSYNASFDAIQSYSNDPLWRQTAYQYCTSADLNGNSSCSMLSIMLAQSHVFTVSENYYQVRSYHILITHV